MSRWKENEAQTREHVPVGPVRIAQRRASPSPTPPKKIVGCRCGGCQPTADQRKPGHVYDADTGIIVGLASEQLKTEHAPGIVWEDGSGGLKRRLVMG